MAFKLVAGLLPRCSGETGEAGESSLLNAMAQEVGGAIGPVPTTADAKEYMLGLEGHPAVVLVDTPGIGDRMSAADLSQQAARADLIVWVASSTQPARGPDRTRLDELRSQAKAQLERRPAPILLALTHVDQLHPAAEWDPPYDVTTPAGPKARSIRAAMNSVAAALDLPVDVVAPVAMPPGRGHYNIDALWSGIAARASAACRSGALWRGADPRRLLHRWPLSAKATVAADMPGCSLMLRVSDAGR